MQKKRFAFLILVFMFLLASCELSQNNDTIPASPTSSPTSPTPTHEHESADVPDSEQPQTDPADDYIPESETADDTAQETEPPKPLHSELYLPECTPQQLTEYFEEVVLNVEYTDGTGDDNLVQKWLSPLYYRIYGPPTDTDLSVLNALFEQLNAIPGFPGIYPATDELPENVSISFLDQAAFHESFSDVIQGEYAFGAVQFWYYTATNELYTARIGYRTDIEQNERNSVLIEEVINILGITDTVLRPGSITYQYSNENMSLSDIDMVILKLLYSPAVQCGMDAAECAAVIQELYY